MSISAYMKNAFEEEDKQNKAIKDENNLIRDIDEAYRTQHNLEREKLPLLKKMMTPKE